MSQSEDKTEQPTVKKLKDARKEGQVSKSADLTGAVSMGAVLLLLAAGSSYLQSSLREIVTIATQFVAGDHSITNMHVQLLKMVRAAVNPVVPCVCAAALAALVVQAIQVGVKVAMKPVVPNLSAIDPMSGLKRIFSRRTVVEMVKMLLKVALVGVVAYYTVRSLFPLIVGSLYQPLESLQQLVGTVVLRLALIITAFFILVGLADVRLQLGLFIKKMMMTKDEVKREYKQREGDPQIKQERRRLAREYVTGPPPASRVHLANMMIVNPTHYAVAIRYAPDEHPLPRVIAKGMDEQAAVLRALARDASVPIIGNPPVARALYRVTVDEPIPEELFETVAAILRWVEAIGAKRNDASFSPSGNTPELPC